MDNNWSANTWENNYNAQVARVNGDPPTGGLPSCHFSRFGALLADRSFPSCLAEKPTSSRTTRAFAVPIPRPSTAMFPRPRCAGGLITDLDRGRRIASLPTIRAALGLNPLVHKCGTSTCRPRIPAARPGHSATALTFRAIKVNLTLPQTSNFGVVRLDHDFGDKWHFMSSYRYFNQQHQPMIRWTSAAFSRAIRWASQLPYQVPR